MSPEAEGRKEMGMCKIGVSCPACAVGVLCLFLLQGCDDTRASPDPIGTVICGIKVIIEDDGIHNPHNVPLARPHVVTTGPLPPSPPSAETYPIPADHFCVDTAQSNMRAAPGRIDTQSRISPVLRRWLDERDGTEIVEIIVSFDDEIQIPRLPERRSPITSGEVSDRRRQAIESLIRARQASQKRHLGQLESRAQFEPTAAFWLVNAVAGNVQLEKVPVIARMSDVAYLQPVHGGESPPSDINPDNDAEDGRALIQSDPYFNLGLTDGFIGLIDTGVDERHPLFNSPDLLNRRLDCVHGGTTCGDDTGPLFEPGDPYNHGTKSAAVLMGSAALGTEFRGATGIKTDSWKVYYGPLPGKLDTTATVNALQAAVDTGNRVLVMEMEAHETELGAIAIGSDDAYDTGAIIVAANGNQGLGANTVRSPAIAHKVIGVGGFRIDTKQTLMDQGEGPATDGRYKPDTHAPSWTETADLLNASGLGVYPGTSGATPYVGAAAMLAYNWLLQHGTFENGHVYAFIILYGQQPWTGDDAIHNEVGAGRVKMATDGWAWWGKTVISQGMTIDIPISIDEGQAGLDLALWWPERADQTHSNIELYALDPVGQRKAASESEHSVWERARVSGELSNGTWKIRIRGENVPEENQVVYWAAVVHEG